VSITPYRRLAIPLDGTPTKGHPERISYLEAAFQDGEQDWIAGDESWFFLSQLPCRIWSIAIDQVATIVRRHIQTKKLMREK
jgi:hypothetical protein